MKVKTFTTNLRDGWKVSLKKLDELVEKELGENIEIYNLKDTLYNEEYISRREKVGEMNKYNSRLARVIVYGEKSPE